MFRLNLYGDAASKRRARSARVGVTAIAALLWGVNLLLFGFHMGSGALLAERTKTILATDRAREREIASLRDTDAIRALPNLEARLASRSGRTLWSPKLAELARLIPRAILIDQITVSDRGKAQTGPSLSIEGSVPVGSGGDPVKQIGSYVEALKASEAFRAGLKDVLLSSVTADEQTGATIFRIVCPLETGHAQ